MDNPTIVVTWIQKNKPEINPYYCCFTVVDVVKGMNVRVKGAGFKPRETVVIKICAQNEKIGSARVNTCGAFETTVTIPGLAPGVVSLKAYVGEDCKAYWPLDIVEKLPNPPKG